MPSNQAAYLTAAGARPLAVRDAPYASPDADSVTVRNGAFAINPCDVMMQELGLFITAWPHVLGCDIAGTVEEVGANVTGLKAGDRVLGMCAATFNDDGNGSFSMSADPGAGGFQQYTTLGAQYVTKIPERMSFEEASVLPLGLLTAASVLYLDFCLHLDWPSAEAKAKEEYVVVWGGSSSVGACGIQLAVNSGYKVITTCSSHNAAFCEDLGAEKAFDHKTAAAVDEIVDYLKGKKVVGIFDAISMGGTIERCVELAQKLEHKTKIMTVQPGSEKGRPEDVDITSVMAHLKADKARKLFGDFLPKALESGKFRAKPDPLVVGKGLEFAQEACDTWKAGISGKKVVVAL